MNKINTLTELLEWFDEPIVMTPAIAQIMLNQLASDEFTDISKKYPIVTANIIAALIIFKQVVSSEK